MKKKEIEILDCTLRDGIRMAEAKIKKNDIIEIIKFLSDSRVEIIELGFLRDYDIEVYNQNFIYFNDIDQAEQIVEKFHGNYALFVDYKMYNINNLPNVSFDSKIKIIRFAFTKSNFENDFTEIEKSIVKILNKGYLVYLQPINILSYTKKELKTIIKLSNKYKISSLAIVDTYGSMYSEDLKDISLFIDKHLHKNIKVSFHSHNSYQLSFSLAQYLVNSIKRSIVIDCTLSGIGKCGGNLPTELICNYLNKKSDKKYDMKMLYNLNDNVILGLKKYYEWGYSQYSLIQGEYQVHPNNIIYLKSNNLNLLNIESVLLKLDDKYKSRYYYDELDKLIPEGEDANNDYSE